ncbi:tyrosine-protein phosphatase [Sphingobacterium sp. LRF_L2]|uniref:tyrosine-protein phosphatase n=1 Tax=Sphingobacterium sp. LRF_L2 TaxID=3369421 RepID=UPI003F6468EA
MGLLERMFGSKKNDVKIKVLGKLAFLEVDMHNHLIPAIDDGSQSVEQSLRLVEGLKHLGFKKFICTPHIMAGVHPNTKGTIGKACVQLQQALKAKDLKVDIVPSAEHMVDEGLLSSMAKNDLCVMPGGYVLIEMSYLAESAAIFKVIYDLQLMGYKPILAHPERYNYYHYNFETYKKIKDTGCLLQLNLLSISRYYGSHVKDAAHTLLKAGMYDFVGTDTHHDKHLAALQEIVSRYPIRELLSNCPIRNASLMDEKDSYELAEVAIG